jgi:tetratricopeptide (TPR) repeat protein
LNLLRAQAAERRAEAALVEARASEAEAIEQRRVADRERRRAEEEKRAAEAVRNFLQSDLLGQASEFSQAETRRLGGEEFDVERNPRIGELLDRAAARLLPQKIEERFPELPFVQAEVLSTVGDAYHMTGFGEKGIEHLRRAVEQYASSRGLDDPGALKARHALADALWMEGRLEEAETLIDGVISDKYRVLGAHHAETFRSQILRGAFFLTRGQAAEAVEYYTPLTASAREHLGPGHIFSIWSAINLAEGQAQLGRFDEAIGEVDRILAVGEFARLPFDHPGVHAAIRVFAGIYKRAGRAADATRLYQKALDAAEAGGRSQHPATWHYRHELAWDRADAGDLDGAMALFRENLRIEDRSRRGTMTRRALAHCLARACRNDEALVLLREALDLEETLRGSDAGTWWTGMLRAVIGRILLQQKKASEAEPYLVGGYRELLDHKGQQPPWDTGALADARHSLIELYTTTGRQEEARRLDADRILELNAALERSRKDSNAKLIDTLQAAGVLGLALVDAGRNDEVIAVFQDAFERIKAAGWPVERDVCAVYDRLRLAVSRAGRHDLAAELAGGVVERLRERPETRREDLDHEVFELASHILWSGRAEEAEPLLRETIAVQRELDPGGWLLAKKTFFLATALLWQGKHEEAERLLLESFELVVDRIDLAPAWEKHFPADVAGRLVELYTALGRTDEAEKWTAEKVKRSVKE